MDRVHDQACWCLMRVVVGFCTASGLATVAGAANERVSEQALAMHLLRHDTARCLWVGNRNFGVWRLARAAAQTQAHLLARLTDVRAWALAGRALAPGEDLAVTWQPSAGTKCDPGRTPAPVARRLFCLRVARHSFRVHTLYLFTTLTDAVAYPPLALLELYGVRWHAELNLRYLKTQLRLNQLDVQSGRLAVQQWYAGLLTYNLLRGVMLWAGTLAVVPPLELSFAQTRWQCRATPQGSEAQWEELLQAVARERQPRRRRPRPWPRPI